MSHADLVVNYRIQFGRQTTTLLFVEPRMDADQHGLKRKEETRRSRFGVAGSQKQSVSICVHPWFLIQEKFVAPLYAKQIVASAQNRDAPSMTTQRKIQPQPIKLGGLGGFPSVDLIVIGSWTTGGSLML